MSSVKLSLLILVILGCIGWLVYYFKNEPAPGETELHRAPIACSSCNKAYDGMIGDEPGRCQLCGKKAAWRAVKCANGKCATVVPWVRSIGEGGAPSPAMKCSKCGGQEFGEVLPEDLAAR